MLSVERGDAVAWVWLDRPERANALGPDFWRDLPRIMDELGDDDSVRVVVLAARGRHFSSGLDLEAMGGALVDGGTSVDGGSGGSRGGGSWVTRRRKAHREITRLQGSITSVAACPKPVVAAVHGACIGAGIDLITACDIRLAAADARFSVRETRMAIVADVGTLQRLPGIVGRGHAAELVYTGRDIDATRANEIGLVTAVHPDVAALHEAAATLAAEIAANSPLAVQGSKAILGAADRRAVEEGLELVGLWNAAFMPSDDLAEALASFVEKRPPRYTGQ